MFIAKDRFENFDTRKKNCEHDPDRCEILQNHSVASNLQSDFGSSPVTSLSVVLDLIASLESKPVGHRSVLFLLLGQNKLVSEAFVSRHCLLDNRNRTQKWDESPC